MTSWFIWITSECGSPTGRQFRTIESACSSGSSSTTARIRRWVLNWRISADSCSSNRPLRKPASATCVTEPCRPISKQRNKHLQTILVEAAKLAPRWSTELALVYEREKQRGNRNRATLAVARKLVAYLMAVDREQRPFDTQLRVAGNAA